MNSIQANLKCTMQTYEVDMFAYFNAILDLLHASLKTITEYTQRNESKKPAKNK